MDKHTVGTMMQSARKVPISDLNECITCKLCKGYFIDATTIIECLHTFCRSCIVGYLESNKYCPICDVQVHKTKPLLNLRPDKTIQDLVYKLVPRLYQNEMQRRKAFYEAHQEGKPTTAEESASAQYDYILAPEESINLTLNYYGCCGAPRYLRCPSAVSITHLKKLIRAKYDLTDRHRVDVFYNQDCLSPALSLMDISYIYSRKRKDPLDLTYKIFECRAKKPKLEVTEKSENNANNTSNNNNNNNWKEVQLRISENGEMSITGIEDSSMLELLDATENFKSEIVMNEGKNVENFQKPVQINATMMKSEVKIDGDGIASAESQDESGFTVIKQDNAQKHVENHVRPSKKELPGLKFIGKTSASSCTTSTLTSTKGSCVESKTTHSGTKVVNSILKTVNSVAKTDSEERKMPSVSFAGVTNCTETNNSTKTSSTSSTKTTSNAKPTKASTDHKSPKNSTTSETSKSMEVSACLNLNNELSVIPLNASTSCVSLTSTSDTTTVFSTINRSMCSTRMDSVQSSQNCEEKSQGVDSKKTTPDNKTDPVVNNISKETKNLKRKCEENEKTPEVPAKLPKPTILNHTIGLMNLSNNHPLKKHSKMNRNGEHLLRTPDLSEKVPISTPTLTVNHVTVSQKSNSMDINASKPIIINKTVSNMQLNRPGTPKLGQRGGQGGNAPCYANKTAYNSLGSLGKAGAKNGENVDGVRGKTETPHSAANSIPKTTISHSIHHPLSFHTPIITPAQLPHHQNLNSLQLKPQTQQEKTSSSTTSTSQSNMMTSQGSTATSQSNLSNIATSHSNLANSQSSELNMTVTQSNTLQKCNEVSKEPPNSSVQTPPHSTNSNFSGHVSVSSSASATPPVQTPPISSASSTQTAIKTKPSTPIGYKTLRDPPKSWNSQINSQIARVNQNVKAQQLANAAAAASQMGGANAQGRFAGDLKSVRPAKFFKGRNMPRYLGCPASGVKPMYQLQQSADKEKNEEQQTVQIKSEKSEIKKHSIVKIDPKTLRPISKKAPETSNLSNMSSNVGLNASQNNQELRINSSSGDLKINISSVSIFNPLKLQSSPKNERKSPKSPHSPKVKSSPNSSNPTAIPTSTSSSSPSPSSTLSPKQHRDKTNLTFTPPNPFVPNLASPTLSPNQFLYPGAGGFPSYDPRVMAAYHSLWYSQRMAAAAAAGFVPPQMPHAFNMNMGLNTGTTTIGQQQHTAGMSPKHSTPPKSGQPSPRANSAASALSTKVSPPQSNKKTKETPLKNDKTLESALSKLTQNKAKESSKHKQLDGSRKMGGAKDVSGGNNAQRCASPKVLGGGNVSLADAQQGRASPKLSGRSSGSTMSALEKLSHNKAIEILGGNSGKRSPIVGEKEGRNAVRGGSTQHLVEKTPTAAQSSKRQCQLTTDGNNSNSSPPKTSEPFEPSQRLNSQPEAKTDGNKSEGEKTSSNQSSASSEPQPVSSELQTRLGQCHEASNEPNGPRSQDSRTAEERSRLGQNEGRLEQALSGAQSNQNGSDSNRSEGSTRETDGTSREQKNPNNTPKVTSSDTTNDDDKKHSNLDVSDIKSQNSGDSSSNSSAKNSDISNGKCDNAVNDESSKPTTGNVANADAFGSVASGEAASTSGENVVGGESGNRADKLGEGGESDKGGGETK